jgi:CheY-like chemotaxis protein
MAMKRNSPDVRPCVAIINTSLETIQMLQDVLAEEGFATAAAYVTEFKRGERDLAAFFRQHQPQAVVYDIAIPYIQNWQFFQNQVLGLDLLSAGRFVVTTTNRSVLEQLVGPTQAIELIGRPYDLQTLISAVQRAASDAHTAPQP